MLRELVREILGQYQYRVIEAASGVEALKAWDEHDGQIDLLLTDMVMPEGMTGSEVAAQLRKRKPELKVIFTSGYSAEVVGKDFSQSDMAFLAKPYLPPQLAQTGASVSGRTLREPPHTSGSGVPRSLSCCTV